jgi:hypothetical protein
VERSNGETGEGHAQPEHPRCHLGEVKVESFADEQKVGFVYFVLNRFFRRARRNRHASREHQTRAHDALLSARERRLSLRLHSLPDRPRFFYICSLESD